MNRNVFVDEVATRIIPDSGFSFTGEDFRAMAQPCVYLYLLGNEALYVGMSGNGISRASSRTHQSASVRQEADRILLYPCHSLKAARDVECILIKALKPKYNSRGGGGGSAIAVAAGRMAAAVRRERRMHSNVVLWEGMNAAQRREWIRSRLSR